MINIHQTDRDISRLHPAIRGKVKKIRDQLHKEKIPFEVFEAFRSPQRQVMLQAKRPKVTWVGPWGSIHQYGLAVDFVLKIDGKWSWDDKGAEAAHWDRMHEIAKANGMTPLFNSKGKLIEKPHVQLAGVSSSELRRGIYPEGGDTVWAEHLGELIDSWTGPVPAPPKPDEAPERPPLDQEDIAEMENAASSPVVDKNALALADAAASARFQNFHGFVKRWEGGFVDHPLDKGGATNMGITIKTLSSWRGAEASVQDVRDLTRAEADAIFWSRYYSACRCGEMPERVAMVVYNCAILSGRKRAIEFVQQGFNSLGLGVDGKPLEVDGVLGRLTMGAIRETDPSVLAEAFMDMQEDYLRGRDEFDTFGAGWMNRMVSLREFITNLPKGEGIRPSVQVKVTEKNAGSDEIDGLVEALRGRGTRSLLVAVLQALLQVDTGEKSLMPQKVTGIDMVPGGRAGGSNAALFAADPITVVNDADGNPPLTPVNAALGETIGNALNGKKSVTGIVGLILTTLLPELGVSGGIVDFLTQHSQSLLTFFSLVTGWGFLGKIDKAVRLAGAVSRQAGASDPGS